MCKACLKLTNYKIALIKLFNKFMKKMKITVLKMYHKNPNNLFFNNQVYFIIYIFFFIFMKNNQFSNINRIQVIFSEL